MPFIDIQTNNLSRQLRNSTTYIDNWVYVPGTAITGDYSRPVPITSLNDFKNLYGTYGPEGSLTFEYVAGLLNAGLPVLFRRIACVNQDTPTQAPGVTKAAVTITHEDVEAEEIVNDFKITEKYGGTFGNTINVSIQLKGSIYWIEVYSKYTLLEKHKIMTVPIGISPVELNQLFINAITTLQLERIEIEVLETDASKFQIHEFTGQYLTDVVGTDFDETLVTNEIAKSFEYLNDKLLFQPKFLTSGGYVDAEPDKSAPIATAMLNLSLARQDCRALIDLPRGTKPEMQQSLAENFVYQQTSDSQAIPSASITAPWCYMQIGTVQQWMPPSYAFLTVIGNALSKGDAVYTPKAGITSGQISNIIRTEFEIGSDLCDAWQSDEKVNINPIIKLQSGSYVIGGNSTLLLPAQGIDENNAFVESSADLTIIEIRRFLYNLGTELQYQYNSTTAFEDFSIRTAKVFERMISDGAMSKYDIINVSTDSEPRKLKVEVDVYLTPTIKSIEIFLNVSYGSVEMTSSSAGGVA